MEPLGDDEALFITVGRNAAWLLPLITPLTASALKTQGSISLSNPVYPSCTHSVPLGNDAESITQCTTVARKPIAMPNLTSPVVVSPLISTHVIQTSLLLHTIDHGLIPCSTCLCINLELSCSTRRE